MGLLNEGINEVIATTEYNAAPMGIRFTRGTFSLTLFIGSHTAENVIRDGWIVANLVFDPVLYVQTGFGDLDRDAFSPINVGRQTMIRLACADAWIAFEAVVEKQTPEIIQVRLVPKKEVCSPVPPRPINRGFNSIIDATVHATRFRINRDPKLKYLIDYHAGIIRKCGGTREREALELLIRMVD